MKNYLAKTKTKLVNASAAALSVLSLSVAYAHAQQTDIVVGGYTLDFGASFGDWSDPNTVINNVINIVLAVAAIAAFLFILWGAFKYVTAGDDSSKTEAARKTITNAVVGLILVGLSFVIWVIVINLTGLNFGTS